MAAGGTAGPLVIASGACFTDIPRSLPTALRRSDIVQIHRGSDKSEVGKRLRKIADLPLRMRIVFFRQQADIVAQRQQAFEQGRCFGVAVYKTIFVSDANACRTDEEHNATLANIMRIFGDVAPTQAVIGRLKTHD